MKASTRQLLIATLMAATGTLAWAQASPNQTPGPDVSSQHHSMWKPDAAHRQAKFAKHMAKLKDKLKITDSQEAAWSSFSDAIKPPAQTPMHANMAEFEQLNTPERIDRMQAMHESQAARMNQRAQATKAFYAQLNPDQQKVFDTESLRMMKHMHQMMSHRH
jgi:hypothetical protein